MPLFTQTLRYMKTYKPSVMMSFNFVAPLSGVLLSVWLLGESLTWQVMGGLVTVGVGLFLITRK